MVTATISVLISITYFADPPIIALTKEVVLVSESSDVQIPCLSRGNPPLIHTKWLRNGRQLPKSFDALIFPNGTLYLRKVRAGHQGVYKCTPFNEIGLGNSAETILKVEGTVLTMYIVQYVLCILYIDL